MNRNVSIWRGNEFPPTTKHVWIDDENNFLLHDGSGWKIVTNTDGNNNEYFPEIIVWNPASNMNDFINSGTYKIEGERTRNDDNLPIMNQGVISGRLEVFETKSNNNKVITLILNLNNNAGGEGNIYTRSYQNGTWKPWGKLQTNIEVGLIDQTKMDDLVDNGIYSGILSTTGETFVIICINNYAIVQQVGVQHISHLKYSLVVGTGEVKIEKRTRDAYGIWTEWENIGGGSTLPEATPNTIGGVRLGSGHFGYLPIRNIDDNPYSGLGIKLGTKRRDFNVVPLVLGEKLTGSCTWDTSWDMNFLGIPIDTRYFNLTSYGLALGSGVNGDSATKVTWDADSNMNDFITAGVYYIYGERTRQDDNLPILNASSGHSIAARLTVVASTLQPDNNEICVTQFLQLSNRVGGDGATYVRTYNENNNGMNGWSAWQKQIGVVETLINGNDVTVGQELISQGHANKIGNGINGMIDNGMYSGIYVDTLNYTGTKDMYAITASPTFLETFVLIVINDYVLAGTEFPRHITQLKYAVDAMTGQSTVKKRVGTGDDDISWGDWEDIGGGESNEVDITDAVKAYGLPTLVAQGLAKEGVNYIINLTYDDINYRANAPVSLDKNDKIVAHLISKVAGSASTCHLLLKLIKNSYNRSIFELTAYELEGDSDGKYYRYIISKDFNSVKVSEDMTEL